MKYTPKPNEIEAVQFNGIESVKEMLDCFGGHFYFDMSNCNNDDKLFMQVNNPEESPRVHLTDWVIMTLEDISGTTYGRFTILTDEVFKKRYTGA